MIKYVLVALALLLLLPLLRRKEKPEQKPAEPKLPKRISKAPEPKKLPSPERDSNDDDDGAPAAGSFDALLRTVVLLLDNDWKSCTIDGVKEEWGRFASDDVQGFSAVPGGRHRVVTEIDGKAATLDFVIFPGDVIVRRLDKERAAWVELEGDGLARHAARAAGGEKGEIGEALVSYRSTMGIARVMSGKLASPEAAFDKAKATLAALVERAGDAATSNVDALAEEAKTAGEALIGIPLVASQLEALAEIARRDPSKRIVAAALPGIAR